MILNELRAPKGAVSKKKRLGRGESSGLGKTAGKGHKGQKARAGGYHKVGFEGGQMPLQRRLPKRGFVSLSRQEFAVINLDQLASVKAGVEVDHAYLLKAGIIKKKLPLKVLGQGELKTALTIKAHAFSQSAITKIEKSGGQAVKLES